MRVITSVFLQAMAFILAGVMTTSAWASERATVKTDSLPVYSSNSPAGKIVKHLKKGEVVLVEMEVVGRGEAWCNIKEEGQSANLGFVPCRELERPPRSQQSVRAAFPQPAATPLAGVVPQEQTSVAEKKPSADVQNFELFRALVRGDSARMKALLRGGADPNLFLYAAACDGQLDKIQFFLENGADVNARVSPEGATPLIGAILRGKVEAVRFLLAQGADVNKPSAGGNTPVRLAKMQMTLSDQVFIPRLNASKELTQKFRDKYFSLLRQVISVLEQAGGKE